MSQYDLTEIHKHELHLGNPLFNCIIYLGISFEVSCSRGQLTISFPKDHLNDLRNGYRDQILVQGCNTEILVEEDQPSRYRQSLVV